MLLTGLELGSLLSEPSFAEVASSCHLGLKASQGSAGDRESVPGSVTQLSAGPGSLLFDFWLEASFHATGTYLISEFTNEITQYRVSFLSFFPPRNINIL